MTGGLPNLIQSLAAKRLKKPDLVTFLTVLLEPIGGVAGLAKRLWEEYDAAEKGSNNRALLLRSIVDMLKILGGKEDPEGSEFEGVSFDEMEANVRKLGADGLAGVLQAGMEAPPNG